MFLYVLDKYVFPHTFKVFSENSSVSFKLVFLYQLSHLYIKYVCVVAFILQLLCLFILLYVFMMYNIFYHFEII